MVSIVMPCFMNERFVGDAIESVIAQTYRNWELIVVDDASKDQSRAVVGAYVQKDSRIMLLKLRRNSGPAVARNTAIAAARGRYIAFLDADDLWMPHKLEAQLSFMQSHQVALSYSDFKIIDAQGKQADIIRRAPDRLDYASLLKENQIGCLAAIYDTQVLGKCYMPEIRKRQDYGLWLQILKQGHVAKKAPGVLARYRISNLSVSSNKLGLIRYNYQLFREVEKFSFVRSVYYVAWNIYRKLIRG
jgi:teichuronic acid biosynthesis glycosyltransferase TuaG